MTDTFAREGVAVLDIEQRLRPRVEAEHRYPSWANDGHWNSVGHGWVAALLYAELAPPRGH